MNLKVSQQILLAIVAEDRFDNPTGAFDAAPQWSVVDPTLATLKVADDGMSAVVLPTGKLGVTQVQVLGTADQKQIQGTMDLTLIAGDATHIVLQAGTPEDQPEQPAPEQPVPAPAA